MSGPSAVFKYLNTRSPVRYDQYEAVCLERDRARGVAVALEQRLTDVIDAARLVTEAHQKVADYKPGGGRVDWKAARGEAIARLRRLLDDGGEA